MISRREALLRGASSAAFLLFGIQNKAEAGVLNIANSSGLLVDFAKSVGASLAAGQLNEWINRQNSQSQSLVHGVNQNISSSNYYTNTINSCVSEDASRADGSIISYPIRGKYTNSNIVAPMYQYDCACGEFVHNVSIHGPTIAALNFLSNDMCKRGYDPNFIRSALVPVGFLNQGFMKDEFGRKYDEPESYFDRSFQAYDNTHHFRTRLGRVFVTYNNDVSETYRGSGTLDAFTLVKGKKISSILETISYIHSV